MAIALNALIDISTERQYNPNGIGYSLAWKAGISDTLKTVVRSGIQGLLRTSKEDDSPMTLYFRKENAFFSGSNKENTFPYFYPFNFVVPLVENQEDSSKAKYSGKVIAMKGYLPKSEYNRLIDRFDPPVNYTRYQNSGPFPYWSSPALTFALVANVLSKYHCLLEE